MNGADQPGVKQVQRLPAQEGSTLSDDTLRRVNNVGQLLVRAGAVLDKVPDSELDQLEALIGLNLQLCLRALLQATVTADPSLAAAAASIDA